MKTTGRLHSVSRLHPSGSPPVPGPWRLVAALGFVCLALGLAGCGSNSGDPQSVPRSGVGDDTIAVFKVDLASMNANNRLQQRIELLSQQTQADWAPFGRLLAALSSNGVSQVALPVNFGPSMTEALGIYLGGKIQCGNEELETAILEATGGGMLAVAALGSAVTETKGGWRFWGVGGGVVSTASRAVAKRYEKAFKEADPAPVQVVILIPNEDLIGDIDPQPSDPRLYRQVGRLLKAAKGMDSLRLAIDPEGPRFSAGALFNNEKSAADFATSWKGLSRDLQLASGKPDSDAVQAVATLVDQLSRLTPKREGLWVRW